MPLISSTSIIRFLSIFHMTVAYYLLTSPHSITEQNLVYVLGESVRVPGAPSLSVPSTPLAFAGLVLGLFGLSDFVSTSSLSGEDVYGVGSNTAFWSSQAIIRLCFFFGLTGYVYSSRFTQGGDFDEDAEDLASGLVEPEQTGGPLIQNSFVFTWAFLELLIWFWVFTTLRDERREAAAKIAEKMKKAEEEALLKTD